MFTQGYVRSTKCIQFLPGRTVTWVGQFIVWAAVGTAGRGHNMLEVSPRHQDIQKYLTWGASRIPLQKFVCCIGDLGPHSVSAEGTKNFQTGKVQGQVCVLVGSHR